MHHIASLFRLFDAFDAWKNSPDDARYKDAWSRANRERAARKLIPSGCDAPKCTKTHHFFDFFPPSLTD